MARPFARGQGAASSICTKCRKEQHVPRLEALGWNSSFDSQIRARREGEEPARVIEAHRGSYRVLGERGPFYAEAAGRLRHEAMSRETFLPSVGDWVLARLPATPEGGAALIERVLPRRTELTRKDPDRGSVEQVIAANMDTVFLVQSLNRDLNPRRLERYLALLWESGAEPVIVLSKSDLCEDPEPLLDLVERSASGVTVHMTSARIPGGLDALSTYLEAGKTAALVGSSGVGKSSIVNALLGEEVQRVQEIREDDRGRHTTTARRLHLLPQGGMLIDTPGMRTVLLLENEEGIGRAFEDVEEIASRCRFRDCGHDAEPGCAVRDALERGTLDPARYRSYGKLLRETRYQAGKLDVRIRLEEQRRWRQIHRDARRRPDKRRI